MCVPFRGALYWGPLRSVARETPAASPPAKLEKKRPRPDRPVCPLHDDVWRYAVSLPSLSFSCLPRPSPACRLAHDPDPGSGASPVGRSHISLHLQFAQPVVLRPTDLQPALFSFFFLLFLDAASLALSLSLNSSLLLSPQQPLSHCPERWSGLQLCSDQSFSQGPVKLTVRSRLNTFQTFFARGDQFFGEVM